MNFSDSITIETQVFNIDRLSIITVLEIISGVIDKSTNSFIEKNTNIRIFTVDNAILSFESLEEFTQNFSNVYQVNFCEVDLIYKFDVKPSPDDICLIMSFRKHQAGKYCIYISLSSKSKTFNEDILTSIKKCMESQFPQNTDKVMAPLNVQITTSPEERKYKSIISEIDNKLRLWHLIISCILTALLTYIVGKLLK